jgi:hypothetical protein
MMRLFKMIPVLIALAVAPAASAIEISNLGATSATIPVGGAFTIELAVDNASLTSNFGITLVASGLAAAGAEVTGGQTSLFHFVGFCSPSNCFAGVNSADNANFNPNDLSGGLYNPGDDSVTVAAALAITATAASGVLDPGLDGAVNVPSARDISIQLIAGAAGVHVITLDGTYSDGVNVLPVQSGTTFTVTVVPEPGTALLMGLGLAGLAAAGRRE